jgi:hypothetical protein
VTRKRIQISFGHAHSSTAGQKTSNSRAAGGPVILDVDFSPETLPLHLHRSRRRKEADGPVARGTRPRHFGCESGQNKPVVGRLGFENGITSVKTSLHTTCIFYRHVL